MKKKYPSGNCVQLIMWLFDLLRFIKKILSPLDSIQNKPEQNKNEFKKNNNKLDVLDASDPLLLLIITDPTIAPFKESRFYCSAADDASNIHGSIFLRSRSAHVRLGAASRPSR